MACERVQKWQTTYSIKSLQLSKDDSGKSFAFLVWAVYLSLARKLPRMSTDGSELPPVEKTLDATNSKDAMKFWHGMVNGSDSIAGSSENAVAYRSLLKNFLSMFLSAFQVSDFAVNNRLADVLGGLLKGQTSLCDSFWEASDDLELPLHSFLNTVRSLFPLQVIPLLNLLHCAICTEYSAQAALYYLHRLPNITWLHQLQSASNRQHSDGLISLEEPMELYEGSVDKLV